VIGAARSTHRRVRPGRAWLVPALLACAIAAPASIARAQGAGPAGDDDSSDRPKLSEPARQRLEAEYLSEAEARALRVFHGVWEEGDLDSPSLRARAALQRGAWMDPSLEDDRADPRDRAEASIARGEPERALELLGEHEDLRALRLRAEALTELARYDEVRAVLDRVADRLLAERIDDPARLTHAIRALVLRQRLFGASAAPAKDAEGDDAGARVAGDFRAIMTLIARVRDELDRLYWPVRLAEAELLYEKHNYKEARQAAREVLALNPGCARAWALLGEASVDAFDFDRAGAIAFRLDSLAASLNGASAAGPSTLGSLIRARARLRQRDPDGAADLLDRMLEVYPTHRRGLAMRAAAAAASFDDEATRRYLERLDEIASGTPIGHYEVGRALSEARQYAPAADHLERAADRLPDWPEPIIELGLLEMQSGRDARAKKALTRAVALDPFDARADNSLRLINELLSYETIRSEHFVVRYRPGVDEVLAREMPPILERIHERVTGEGPGGIDFEPSRRTVIELMPDHEWFSVRITGMPQIHTMAASTGPVIAMESPREGPGHRAGPYDWARVVQHEYAHTVTLARTRNRIPHWFTEAAAVYLEDAPRPTPWIGLLTEAHEKDELFDLGEISIAFVRPERPQDRTLAYAQGHWMYEFMIQRWGGDAPLHLMDRYAAGEDEAGAMRAVLGVSRDEFMARFRQWAGGQLVEWGVAPGPDRPPLRSLLKEMYDAPDAPDAPTWAWIQRWLEAHPDHPALLELAAETRRQLAGGEVDERAARLLERLAEARPVDPDPRRTLVRFYLDSDDPARAIPHLQWLDAREQHSPAYAAELARRYAALGQWERAGEKAERATVIAPFDADYREFAARVALKRGDRATARRHIVALTRIEPDREIHQRRLEAIDRLSARAPE